MKRIDPRKLCPRKYAAKLYWMLYRRVQKRAKYMHLEWCYYDEFLAWMEGNRDYLRIYDNWYNKRFSTKLTPTVDRIDPSRGYTLDNIRIVTMSENSKRVKRGKLTDEEVRLIRSMKKAEDKKAVNRELSEKLGVPIRTILRVQRREMYRGVKDIRKPKTTECCSGRQCAQPTIPVAEEQGAPTDPVVC